MRDARLPAAGTRLETRTWCGRWTGQSLEVWVRRVSCWRVCLCAPWPPPGAFTYNSFATAVSRVLLGRKKQTWALSAVSRRDLSGKLTWGASRRLLHFSAPSYMQAVLKKSVSARIVIVIVMRDCMWNWLRFSPRATWVHARVHSRIYRVSAAGAPPWRRAGLCGRPARPPPPCDGAACCTFLHHCAARHRSRTCQAGCGFWQPRRLLRWCARRSRTSAPAVG